MCRSLSFAKTKWAKKIEVNFSKRWRKLVLERRRRLLEHPEPSAASNANNPKEQKELKSLLSLNKSELSEEIIKSKKVVLSKLSEKINESKDIELNDQVKKTIEKINESDVSLTSLYKLKQLEQGL